MATVYHELGAKVTIVELMDQLIPGADKDLISPLAKRVTRQDENIYLKTTVTGVEARRSNRKTALPGCSSCSTPNGQPRSAGSPSATSRPPVTRCGSGSAASRPSSPSPSAPWSCSW